MKAKLKPLILLLFLSTSVLVSKAQIQKDPATWAYGLKKISGNSFEVHLRCSLESGWHIYAQEQTDDFIGTKTKIVFEKQKGLKLIGKPQERGKKDTYVAKEVGITNYEYANIVDFVQKVTIQPGVNKIKGSVTYQTCTHERCLSEKTVEFAVPVIKTGR